MHELIERLPNGATVYADKGYNSGEDKAWIEGETSIRLVPRRREEMAPNTLTETFGLVRHRGRIETVHSQSAAWGVALDWRVHDADVPDAVPEEPGEEAPTMRPIRPTGPPFVTIILPVACAIGAARRIVPEITRD